MKQHYKRSRILHAPGASSVHDSFRQVSLEPGSSGQVGWFGVGFKADFLTRDLGL